MSFLLLVLGIDCLLMAFVPKEQSRLVLVLFSVGRFASAATSSLCWLYTAELYPTNLRSQAVGTCSLVSRFYYYCNILSKFFAPSSKLYMNMNHMFMYMYMFMLP